ncbi:sigma 54-interacting transcriptional regulator [Tenuibacillus multivorans]|uniref:PAS domain S-box-containing protein n=1 Tax=Tenuibacillus multivorans TaxID=237069 RepID=A0A1G9Z6K9_9BACI|nr:sigma 54-interacting transcriptional regulator [Tenuibacillus multivorans]GEL77389.1 putative sigma L-dependent transcriptional regulator YqiR [Tenuibacillus multivorans]SDN16685.1 PAS domain S-box-containing protein [Tenuibacillus multivorans]
MQNVIIVGAGNGGSAILKLFDQAEMLNITGVADIDSHAPGIKIAQSLNIHTYRNYRQAIDDSIDILVETTGDQEVFHDLMAIKPKHCVLIPGTVAHVMFELLNEKECLLEQIQKNTKKRDMVLNSIHDGLIVIDPNETITMANESASKILEFPVEKMILRKVLDIIPDSKLPKIFETREQEVNQRLTLNNGKKIITTRIPLISDSGEALGAFAVFKDITDVVSLAEEITNLKDIQVMLEAIIQSSEEAISVVDESGKGIMINPAYTKITGLSEKDVIGKPATADISEGESMHMKVLQTRQAVRGARMKVGPHKRDVLVNVAPIIVDGKLKGSVGVIHDLSEIESLTSELKRARQIIRDLEAKYTFDDIVAKSTDMILALEQAKLGARTPTTVLLRGESGTGKELIAHAIHNESKRQHMKFIRVNCAAFDEEVLDRLLFGDERGSPEQQIGYFEEAHQGSIFLDEIGDLSKDLQAKILRVLEDQTIIRVGGSEPIYVDVRIIAATNVNLERAIMSGEFREDLYYRLSKFPINIPPLRERMEDLYPLVHYLISQLNENYGRSVETISDEALEKLRKYNYPGNVRELDNIIGRAMINMEIQDEIIRGKHLPPLRKTSFDDLDIMNGSYDDEVISLQAALDEFEKQLLIETLEKNNFIKSKTAKQLKISIRNLYYKMNKYNLGKDT